MLFQRREPLSRMARLRNIIWPRMGWGRTLRYLKHRAIRIPNSTYSIAAGLSIGCVVSWTPTLGVHLIQCVFFCWILRANWLASFLGSLFGNPWTFPVLFWISYQVGKAVFELLGYGGLFHELPDPVPMEEMMDQPMKIYLPMLVGGYICAVVTFPAFYYTFYYMIKGARTARRKRIERKVHKVAKEVTGQKT